MPNTDAARKAIRTSARKGARNTHWRYRIENLQRKFRKAVSAKNATEANALFRDLQKTVDAAAQRHIIHRNTAARTKSRLADAVRRL